MWRLGFFFHEIVFGLLSVFIPLYVVAFQDTSSLGGPLVALGIMTSVAIFSTIPASFFWGYICDATRHYKIFILLSFSSSALIFFLFTLPFAQNFLVFFILYVAMQVFHVAHEAPKNVLIAEHYTREEWENSFAFYEGLTEIGFIAGLAIGLFAFVSTVTLGVGDLVATYSFYLCSVLSLVAFVLSIFMIADPIMIFERRLVGMEKRMDYTYRGLESSSKVLSGLPWDGKLKQDSFKGFALAIVLFSLATSLFFTPLPVFLNQELNLSTSMVFVMIILDSVGATIGYFLIGRLARNLNKRKQMPRFVLLRGLLVFLLVGVVQFAFLPTIMTGIILAFVGFAYAMYYILMLSLSMELIPSGKSGVFDVLVGLGAGVGSFLGPFLAHSLNYLPMFLIAAVVYVGAFITLKLSS